MARSEREATQLRPAKKVRGSELRGPACEAQDRLIRWLCGLPAKGVREVTRGRNKGKVEVNVRGQVYRFSGPKHAVVERVE
jgi:hypothetical protein